jgi:hypothetical protein
MKPPASNLGKYLSGTRGDHMPLRKAKKKKKPHHKKAFMQGFKQRWLELEKRAWIPTAIGAGLGALAGSGLGYYLSDPEGDSRSTMRNTLLSGVGGGLLGLGAGLGTNDFRALRQWVGLQLEDVAQAVRSGHGNSPTIRTKLDELSKQPLTPGERAIVKGLRETGGPVPPPPVNPRDAQTALQKDWEDALTPEEYEYDDAWLRGDFHRKKAPVNGRFIPFDQESTPTDQLPLGWSKR